MRADNAFLLGFGEHVHGAAEALSPIALGNAVHQANVEVVGAEFPPETVEVCAHPRGITSPTLGEQGDLIALHVLEGFGDVRMASIGISRVEEAQAMVVSIQQKIREALYSERGLMRMVIEAHGAGAHSETAGLNAGAAERDRVAGCELSRKRLVCDCIEDGLGREPGCSCRSGGSDEEFSTMHEAS